MNKLKFSVPGQMLLMVRTHFTTAIVFMILFLMTTSMRGNIGNVVFGIFGFLGYFLAIYANASSAYLNDKMDASPLTPKPTKGFILPLFIIAINLLIVFLYKMAWTYGSDGESMTEIWSLILNIISLLWISPYQPLLGMAYGFIKPIGYIIIFLTPVIASALGYIAAYKGFDLNAKVHGLIYEKKKEEDKSEF